MSTSKKCVPTCRFFICKRKAYIKAEVPFCNWIQAECEGPSCVYVICKRKKLLVGGICALSLKPREIRREIPEEFEFELPVKRKVLRKIPKEEIF